ncbi:hypothetical protein MLD38_021731 [Melastoma candidum]|uniref:Uncharacterized protein n=1 Tax=Melastoma candidum TaxID=119954 RepID=A0ACB9QGD6_9MYRT|nr:hypothetical protein MLD38_021731 [Melastoma candidum]
MGSGGIGSSWDGTLSVSEFRAAAVAFADRWRISGSSLPPWSWVPVDEQHRWLSRQVDGFLSMENVCMMRSAGDRDAAAEEMGPCGLDEPVDVATLVPRGGSDSDVNRCDLNIIYSHSYRLPVLYFRVYSSDGQPLALCDFERHLPSDSVEAIVGSKWTFITQEEHPYLKRPWYKLHPCGTSEWVKLLLLSDTSVATRDDAVDLYLLSWFSVVGRVIGVSIPFETTRSLD